MRPIRLRRHGLRVVLATTAVLGALLATSVVPAAAASGVAVPAISGLVTDQCTGLPVGTGLTIALDAHDGSVLRPPNPNFLGLFSFPSLAPGSYQLQVSAPGYVTLGSTDPATGASPEVPITNPGPIGLPTGQSIAVGQFLDIRLAPLTPAATCKPPNPNLPAVAGRGVDAATGMGLSGLVVGVAPIDSTGLPGSIQRPPNPNFFGLFAFPTISGLSGSGFQFYATAPGHTSLGAEPTALSSLNGPGVFVEKNPGPIGLPAGSGTLSVSIVIVFALPAGPADG
jgi:hypothetical protein